MKVDIKPVETSQGWVFRKRFYGVETKVVFTNEERAIIKERNLQRHLLMERTRPMYGKGGRKANIIVRLLYFSMGERSPRNWNLYVRDLMRTKPDVYYMGTTLEQKEYVAEMKEAIRQLRYLLDVNAEAAEAESFEV